MLQLKHLKVQMLEHFITHNTSTNAYVSDRQFHQEIHLTWQWMSSVHYGNLLGIHNEMHTALCVIFVISDNYVKHLGPKGCVLLICKMLGAFRACESLLLCIVLQLN